VKCPTKDILKFKHQLMDFTCIEIKGAAYQPLNIFPLGSFQIIPATEDNGVLKIEELKIILISEKQMKDLRLEVKLFVFCYQFLFLVSDVYYFCSLPGNPITFSESSRDINDASKKYKRSGPHKVNFNKIDIFYTKLSNKIKFQVFYKEFSEKYLKNDSFKNIIDLYLYTIGSKPKFYDNIFQKISQLQTIFETILGTPEEEVLSCGKRHYKEDWKPFLTKKLKEKGISNEEANLIIKIKNILNWSARVKYTHYSKQLSTWQKTLEEIKTGNLHEGKSEYTTDFEKIMNKTLKTKNWTGLDWENVYYLYQTIVKQLIFQEYFKE